MSYPYRNQAVRGLSTLGVPNVPMDSPELAAAIQESTYDSLGPAPSVGRRAPQVAIALDEAARSLEALHQSILNLEGRLGPVLNPHAPASPAGGRQEGPRPSTAPLVESLRDINEKLALMTQMVVNLAERVEV